MGDLVNLNKIKKQRQKQATAVLADANRWLHGRTKAQKAQDDATRRKAKACLDQAKLEPDDPSG